MENENARLRNEFEQRINEYEDTLNKKLEENKNNQNTISTLTEKINSLNLQIQNMSMMSSSGGG